MQSRSMAESIQTKKFVDLERSTKPAHADWTIIESRQSLALDEAPSSPANVVCGQEPSPLQQYHQKTDEGMEPTLDGATCCTGHSPGGTGLRRSSSINTRARSSASIASRRSSSSMHSIEIAHWTNSFVLYTPVPPPRPKQPYRPVDPDPPSLPPLTLGSSISDGLLPEESPVFQPLPDIPELPNLDFPWMLGTTDRSEGADTELRPSEDISRSSSTIFDPASALDDDTRSSSSTFSDSDGPCMVNFPQESYASPMDQPATGHLSPRYSLELGDRRLSPEERFPENLPVTPAASTAKPSNLHNKLVVMPERLRKKLNLVALARFDPPVVAAPQSPLTEPQHGDIIIVSSRHTSFAATSEYNVGCVCYRC
ncbi:hypothetical protein EDD17DRAFT_1126107 [Pisolithus thermaeus]|nr:hypothetical protein EDD17DRAFT_1126107 [Pisolithus thermaeus]